MKRPTPEDWGDLGIASTGFYIIALNTYIDWLEGKGLHHDGTEVSHDTEHVCEDEAGPIPNRIEGHAFGKGGTKTYHPSGGEEEGAD